MNLEKKRWDMIKVNKMVSGIENISKNNLYVCFSYKNLVGHQLNLTDGSC